LQALGGDRAAIRTSDRAGLVFDLGLGIGATDFCVRTSDQALARGLEQAVGKPWPELLASLGGPIQAVSPNRVVRSPAGRIEVFTPIPQAGGRSPDGPHTHLMPAYLGQGRETPPGIDLPDSLMPCAIFYPAAHADDSCA
jgi:hypothetical protein